MRRNCTRIITQFFKKIIAFRSSFESIVSNQRHLESVVYRMGLEQDLIEEQIQAIETTVGKILEKEDEKDASETNQVVTENCLRIFGSLKQYDSILTKAIEDLNKEINGRGDEDGERGLNLAVNNFYNAISVIEGRLAKIQVSLNKYV